MWPHKPIRLTEQQGWQFPPRSASSDYCMRLPIKFAVLCTRWGVVNSYGCFSIQPETCHVATCINRFELQVDEVGNFRRAQLQATTPCDYPSNLLYYALRGVL